MTPASSRRGFLRSTCRHCIALGAATALPGFAQSLDSIGVPSRFKRPSLDTDEGGLWGMMDREESRLKRSPLSIADQGLKDYLTGLVAKLADTHAPDIRVHPVRVPQFNAMMAPNGMMLVWSGLLLRMENEAQLVAVLGHELGHYLERHQLEQLRAAKNHAVFMQVVAMVGGIGSVVGQLGALASLFAYSREHEQRADRMGMRLMQRVGYDGREASRVWANLLDEIRVTEGKEAGKNGDMFATHPNTASRREDLLQLAGTRGGDKGEDRFRAAIAPLRMAWIQDEIKRGQFEESLVLFDRLLKVRPEDVEVRFARGEVYRQRDEPDDALRAIADLRQATAAAKPPAAAFRSLGLAYKDRRDNAAAVDAFERYLALAPEAFDAGLVRSYVGDLKR